MRLFLVDSSIFIFKSWYGADPARTNRRQQPNQAFIGFSDFVWRLLSEQAPTRIVFAFDESLQASARKTIYPAYKANRSPTPPALKRQFQWCRQWVEALGISCVSSSHWEADDLIGSLAHYHRSRQLPLAILTADKDLTQLLVERDWWWSYLDDKKLDVMAVRKKFGVGPHQIADQLALTGDKVDNIPGIPEVGPKTAALLLKKYDTLENLQLHLHEVGNMRFRYAARVQRSLLENEARLEVNASLTRINCRLEAMRAIDIKRRAPDSALLARLMRQQAFDSARVARWHALLDVGLAGAE